MKMTFPTAVAFSLIVGACASTSVTPVSRNQLMISTSAAPVCGSAGAKRVAAKMAAVETIRSGYDGFIIGGMQSENNVQVVNRAPTNAYTTGTINTFGNSATGTFNTTYSGGGPLIFGTNDTDLLITMFRKNERGYRQSIDARATLGSEWPELVETGVKTCS